MSWFNMDCSTAERGGEPLPIKVWAVWCPCVWTYKEEKQPVSRHLLSKSPRADNWCDRQFSLTPCQQNSSWAAHSSPHSIKAWTYHKKHGKDFLVVNSNNTNRNSSPLRPVCIIKLRYARKEARWWGCGVSWSQMSLSLLLPKWNYWSAVKVALI